MSTDRIITRVFENLASYIRNSASIDSGAAANARYMEISISSDVVEIPLFALGHFIRIVDKKTDSGTIVAKFHNYQRACTMKSAEAAVKCGISGWKWGESLTKLAVKGTDDAYYTTFGTVLDKTLNPVAMFSWVLEKYTDNTGNTRYRCKYPLLRIDPQVYIERSDTIQRYIVNRLALAALACNTDYAPLYWASDNFDTHYRHSDMKIEIDKCPFVIKGVSPPSVSATNRQLLQLAAEHIDEILQ